ncbi:hypothetical protein H0H93_013615 [Arthromyces matolae]|nr:hypothetical protein H0H93_013615 [Arthromyces matolae]
MIYPLTAPTPSTSTVPAAATNENPITVSSDADFADAPNIDPSTVKLGSRACKPRKRKTTTANKNKNTVAAPPIQPCPDNKNSPPIAKRKRKRLIAPQSLESNSEHPASKIKPSSSAKAKENTNPSARTCASRKKTDIEKSKTTSEDTKSYRLTKPAVETFLSGARQIHLAFEKERTQQVTTNLELKKCELAILQEQNHLLAEKAQLLAAYPNINPKFSDAQTSILAMGTGSEFDAPAA